MMKLDYTKLVLDEDVKKGFDKAGEKFAPETVVKNVFIQCVQSVYAKGATLEVQRKYAKVIEKLEANEELSDEQFAFLMESFEKSTLPASTLVPRIADWLDLQKLEAKTAEASK